MEVIIAVWLTCAVMILARVYTAVKIDGMDIDVITALGVLITAVIGGPALLLWLMLPIKESKDGN